LEVASALHYLGSKATRTNVMNTKALIASLVLGSSSVAMAAPGIAVTASARASIGTTVVRDHRVDDYRVPAASPPAQPAYGHTVYSPPIVRPDWRPDWRPAPVTLATSQQIPGEGWKLVNVGSQIGRFGSLQISAAGSRVYVQQVYVQFDDGSTQVIRNLDRMLVGNQSLTLDLDGNRRALRRVIVYGKQPTSGIRRATGAFTLTAL
jgi:hypothetical protein